MNDSFKPMNRLLDALMCLLDDRRWYSLRIDHVRDRLGIDRQTLDRLIGVSDDPINTFWFPPEGEPDAEEWVGFVRRGVDYERDMRSGRNPIHDRLLLGEYGERSQQLAREQAR